MYRIKKSERRLKNEKMEENSGVAFHCAPAP